MHGQQYNLIENRRVHETAKKIGMIWANALSKGECREYIGFEIKKESEYVWVKYRALQDLQALKDLKALQALQALQDHKGHGDHRERKD
ncbi:hypothetical protein [Paenibacillus tyrfis]|uniref:hypothetical protein n=1 Tax=Paenibacillus tyrfis TaxID=1501230 RepID=UPI001F17CF27|nr:hypothetical protein [Paenibacillus tyrfis]